MDKLVYLYYPLLLLLFLLTIVFFAVANYYPVFTAMARKPYNRLVHVILEGPGQMISAYTFVMLIILLGPHVPASKVHP